MFTPVLLTVSLALSVQVKPPEDHCLVSEAQRLEANNADWRTFDQTGGLPGTYRDLANNGCKAEAVAAYYAWLEHNGGFPNQRARGIGNFHIGQLLALTGQREEAITAIMNSKRDEELEGVPAADWNAYIDGVLGFFAQDTARIKRAKKRLAQSDRAFAMRQYGVLSGLQRCLDQPYEVAMSPACQR